MTREEKLDSVKTRIKEIRAQTKENKGSMSPAIKRELEALYTQEHHIENLIKKTTEKKR